VPNIKNILNQTGLKPQYLELELTESGIMENEKDSIKKLNELHDLGVKITIDDFGTGYSSLSKLKDYPIDMLKIDRSFVANLPGDKKSSTITTTIIDLAHNLGFKVIAEGVETKEQLDFLHLHNCDQYQGYYFSRPIPAEKIEEMLKLLKII
jgi:EAL domain-containing protein (putative c-di-GMP-specific phosphodiesterase class I)